METNTGTPQNATLDAADFVALAPPLPCVADAVGAGFVRAIAPDRLLVGFVGDAAPGALARLTVSAPAHGTFALTAALVAPAAGTAAAAGETLLEARLTDPASLDRLDNLLALVRKSQHIQICATMDVEATDRYTGLSDVALLPRALPELAWSDLDTSRRFLGRDFALPLLVTGMTGGLERGAEINRRLALAAEAFGIPMGVGSQRIALEHPEHAAIFAVKKHAPRVFLIANLGVAQMAAEGRIGARRAVEACRRAVEMIEADALAVHVNVLQEVVQVEGDRDFRDLTDRIHEIVRALPVPVVVKEVGGGIDGATAARLVEAGVAAVDVGGKGGTSWSFIEGVRASSPVTRSVADTFRDWGIPTAVGVALLRRDHPGLELVATGGVRDGLAVAKAIGLGATMAGVGLPLFRAALQGEAEPHAVLATFAQGLRTAMLCSGSRDLAALPARTRRAAAFHEACALFDDVVRSS